MLLKPTAEIFSDLGIPWRPVLQECHLAPAVRADLWHHPVLCHQVDQELHRLQGDRHDLAAHLNLDCLCHQDDLPTTVKLKTAELLMTLHLRDTGCHLSSCHMGSHSVTFHSTQVSTPSFNPSWRLVLVVLPSTRHK